MISEMQKKMLEAVGHKVEIKIYGGYKLLKGKCKHFTQPMDNEPEVASIDIAVPGITSSLYEVTEDEIEELTITD